MLPETSPTPPAAPPALPCRRLAVLGAWAPHRSEDAIVRAARRLGLAAKAFDVLRQTRRFGALARPLLERAVEHFNPDFILCTRHAWLLGPERLTRLMRGRASAFWYFDLPELPEVVPLAQCCDVMYTTSANQRARYRKLGVDEVRYLPQALDIDHAKPAERVRQSDICDVSFTGSGNYPHRWPLLELVASHFTLQIRGRGWEEAPASLPIVGGPVYLARLAEVIAGAKVTLGANAVAAQDGEVGSASDRMWKVLGCGGAYVGQHVEGIESLATDREHCRWYHTPAEAVTVIAELLADDAARRAMAARGRAHALAHHSYDARLRLLLSGGEYSLSAATQTVT